MSSSLIQAIDDAEGPDGRKYIDIGIQVDLNKSASNKHHHQGVDLGKFCSSSFLYSIEKPTRLKLFKIEGDSCAFFTSCQEVSF